MMNREFSNGSEVADQHDLSRVLLAGASWLIKYGEKNGREPTKRYADGTAEYLIEDDKGFVEVEAYDFSVDESHIISKKSWAHNALEVGKEIHLSYVPTHYLYSPGVGRYEWYPESFQVTVATRPDSIYKEQHFSITSHDPDDEQLLGFKHVVSRNKIKRYVGNVDESYWEDPMEHIRRAIEENLMSLTREECSALLSIIQEL